MRPVVVTDALAGYPPAVKRVPPHAEHRRHKGVNGRAESSHRPVRKRERVLRHLVPAELYGQIRAERFQQWREGARLRGAA